MKNLLVCLLLLFPFLTNAQLGIKVGPNFANITNANEINNTARAGFHAGILFAGSNRSIFSSRTEFLFSRQSYSFKTSSNTGKAGLDYLLLPQLFALNITPLFQIQAGGQIAYLLNAKVDTTLATGNGTIDKAINIYNRIDFSFAAGFEVHPIKMVIVGARLNVSLGRLYKVPEPGEQYSFIPDFNARNNLFQLYAGLKFGG